MSLTPQAARLSGISNSTNARPSLARVGRLKRWFTSRPRQMAPRSVRQRLNLGFSAPPRQSPENYGSATPDNLSCPACFPPRLAQPPPLDGAGQGVGWTLGAGV